MGTRYPPLIGGCVEANVPMRFEPMPTDAGLRAFD
jgi:hypothetical protein